MSAADAMVKQEARDAMINQDTLDASDSPSGAGGSSKKGSFRRVRSRAARACEVCHARKVRCDVVNHQPCTNCVAFACECRIPESKTKKPRSGSNRNGSADASAHSDDASSQSAGITAEAGENGEDKPKPGSAPPQAPIQTPMRSPVELKLQGQPGRPRTPPNSMLARENGDSGDAHAKDAVFMGSASHISLFIQDPNESAEIAHIYTPWAGRRARLMDLQKEDIAVLKMKGAFLLPSKEICDDLVRAYFRRIHPVLPVINKTQFLRQYEDPKNPPPLLLKQAIFCAASNVCSNPAILDEEGRSRGTALIFYNRAKALFDAEFEEDRTVALTSALILSLSLDAPDKTNNNAFYWTRMAVTIAQSIGIHRWMPKGRMPEIEKRMWKRLWWSLFLRDRSTSTAYGRPMSLNLEDTDIPMIEPEDFDESEPGQLPAIPPNEDHVTVFIHMVKLHEIMGLVLRQQYSVGAERLRLQNQLPDVSQCDMALATWVNNLPINVRYSIRDVSRHDYFKALIYLQYYTVLCLAHRPQVVHFSQNMPNAYPSWGIAFQAAHMIVKILENLRRFDEVSSLPAFCVYTCFSALIMLVYQTESPHENVLKTAQSALRSLMIDIETLAKVYEAARQIVLYAPFLSSQQVKSRALRIPKRKRDNSRRTDTKRPNVASGAGSAPNSQDPSPMSSRDPSRAQSRNPSRANSRPGSRVNSRPSSRRGSFHDAAVAVDKANPLEKGTLNGRKNDSSYQLPVRFSEDPDGVNGDVDEPLPGEPFSPELYMVTQSPTLQFDEFEPQLLFPQASEAANEGQTPNDFFEPLFTGDREMREALADETNSNSNSSGDELSAPDQLNMGDWYEFLMSNSTRP